MWNDYLDSQSSVSVCWAEKGLCICRDCSNENELSRDLKNPDKRQGETKVFTNGVNIRARSVRDELIMKVVVSWGNMQFNNSGTVEPL